MSLTLFLKLQIALTQTSRSIGIDSILKVSSFLVFLHFNRRLAVARNFPLSACPRSSRHFKPPPSILDLWSHAVAAEHDEQADREDHDADVASNDQLDAELDALDDIGDNLPLDPLNDVDDDNPRPRKRPRRRSHSPSFAEVVASADIPLTGPHHRRPANPQRLVQKEAVRARRQKKRSQKKQERGHVPASPTIRAQIHPAIPLTTGLTTFTLPAASGAYVAKTEAKDERRGSKVKRSVADLLVLGFRLVQWDGFTPIPLVDSNGRIVAVLAGQPRNDEYREAVQCAFQFICKTGAAACFPASMSVHRRGLYAVINVGLVYGKALRGQTKPSVAS
ncbi:hypothetical protein B0H17DRAFT_1217452 [Mycena rosella]|uniref:Uncharacterized protein n=1 Tax=Mycena rosella TaxID=1033263 RepID=A0AAD7FQP9_MYCRO|nr:hypothetical protein B0H17DRAFT_1217452 [Mycena rosella]